MSSSFWAVWFEEKGRFRGEFEAAEVFPAEDSMIQVRSRGNASHFVERKSPSSPISEHSVFDTGTPIQRTKAQCGYDLLRL